MPSAHPLREIGLRNFDTIEINFVLLPLGIYPLGWAEKLKMSKTHHGHEVPPGAASIHVTYGQIEQLSHPGPPSFGALAARSQESY